jgi:hypothetical protein
VIAGTKQVLATAQRGLADIASGDPERLVTGLHNVAVFGRMVAFALQNLRNIAEGFEDWYATAVPTDDPLLKYMVSVRNEIEKQARMPRVSTSVHIEYLAGDPRKVLRGSPPPGATGMFIGENATGGSGWIVKLPDGTEQKYYAALSSEFRGEVTTHLPDAPTTFLGVTYADTTTAGIARRYLAWLESLVTEAERRFA